MGFLGLFFGNFKRKGIFLRYTFEKTQFFDFDKFKLFFDIFLKYLFLDYFLPYF